jgi:DNA end-binding protein Ku
MRPRSSWKGYLRLSLVTCAVALFPANTTSEKISFRQVNRRTGNRVRQRLVDEASQEPVESADIARGYEVAKGSYILVEDEDFARIRIESTQTLDLETFVPAEEVDPVYLDGAHYLAPDDRISGEAFAVIREAMTRQGLVGIGRVVINRRERLLMLSPRGKGMLATTVRYPYEVRQDADYFNDIPDVDLPDDMIDLAASIIDRKKSSFDPSLFTDRYENALIEMLKAKQAGQQIEQPKAAQPMKVLDIMEALRRSLEADKPKEPARKSSSSRSKKTADGGKPAPAASPKSRSTKSAAQSASKSAKSAKS